MKIIDKYVYEIDEANAVRVWEKDKHDNNEPPFIFQPTHPDNTEFTSIEDAETWAEDYINSRVEAANTPPVTE